MRSRSQFDAILLLYYRFKETPYYHGVVSVGIIFACIILIFALIVPQLNQWFSINNEIEATRGRITAIQKNMQFLTALNSNRLDENHRIVNAALPLENDFVGIINSITVSAVNSGISLRNYNFEPGSLNFEDNAPGTSPVNTSELRLSVEGPVPAIQEFTKELLEKVPLVAIHEFSITGQTADLSLSFFYKRPPQIPLNETEPLSEVSSEHKALLGKLAQWKESLGNAPAEDKPTEEDLTGEVNPPF